MTFATARHRTKVTKGLGSKAAGIALFAHSGNVKDASAIPRASPMATKDQITSQTIRRPASPHKSSQVAGAATGVIQTPLFTNLAAKASLAGT